MSKLKLWLQKEGKKTDPFLWFHLVSLCSAFLRSMPSPCAPPGSWRVLTPPLGTMWPVEAWTTSAPFTAWRRVKATSGSAGNYLAIQVRVASSSHSPRPPSQTLFRRACTSPPSHGNPQFWSFCNNKALFSLLLVKKIIQSLLSWAQIGQILATPWQDFIICGNEALYITSHLWKLKNNILNGQFKH